VAVTSSERGEPPSPPAEPAGPLPPDSLRSSIQPAGQADAQGDAIAFVLGLGLVAAAVAAFCSVIAASLWRAVTPSIVTIAALLVLLPGMLLLVPGSLGLRGVSSLLDRDTLTGVESVFATGVVAMAIVAGLLIANAVVSPRRSL
jgi:uncharacterized membrane protein YjjB (DUF3815 family)